MSKNKPSAKPNTTAGDIAPGASAAQTATGNTTMATTCPAPHAATATPAAPTPAVTDSALHPDAAALGAPHAPLAPAGYIRLSGPIEHDSIVNGDGLRAVLWTQGCQQHCEGCQNPETWDLAGGLLVKIDEVKARLARLKGQTGLTFCGGEPFLQPEACLEIAEFCIQELGWDCWSFCGFTYEDILATALTGKLENQWARGQFQPGHHYLPADGNDLRSRADQLLAVNTPEIRFLKSLSALIDGPFVLAERDLTLRFRGSRNQRLLHLDQGRIIKIE